MWIPQSLVGATTRHLYGSIYKLSYLGKTSYVSKLGERSIQPDINVLTPEELRMIAKDKDNDSNNKDNKDNKYEFK